MLCLDDFGKYFESIVSVTFCVLSLFLVNGPHNFYANSGCLECILIKNIFSSNKKLWTVPFILYSITVLIPLKQNHLIMAPPSSSFLINLDILLLHTAHFDKSVAVFFHY